MITTIKTLSFSSILLVASACEGEPPKVPENPPATADAAEPNVAAAAEKAVAATPAPGVSSSTATPAASPCQGMSADKMAAHAVGPTSEPGASAAPGAPSAPVVAPATVAAAASATHSIEGTVTSVPAQVAGTAVVYLEDAGLVPERGGSARVDNHGMSFAPYISVVSAGGRVVFSNSDPFPHNVFSPDNEKFNLGMVQMKSSSAHVFKSPGAYTLLCNLHPNMIGYVVVSPSSYFAKTNAKGHFTIKDVPPGTYKITAWAPRLQTATQPVTLKDADATVDFSLHR